MVNTLMRNIQLRNIDIIYIYIYMLVLLLILLGVGQCVFDYPYACDCNEHMSEEVCNARKCKWSAQ